MKNIFNNMDKLVKTLDTAINDLTKIRNSYKVNLNSVVIENIVTNDYPDFSDAFISYALYENGVELTDEELDELTDSGLANELIHDRQLN